MSEVEEKIKKLKGELACNRITAVLQFCRVMHSEFPMLQRSMPCDKCNVNAVCSILSKLLFEVVGKLEAQK